MSIYKGIVKPHYRLLGMLMERHDLRMELMTRTGVHSGESLQNDLATVDLERKIEALDAEIRSHQSHVRRHFKAEGRSLNELKSFIGDDLMRELSSIRGKVS